MTHEPLLLALVIPVTRTGNGLWETPITVKFASRINYNESRVKKKIPSRLHRATLSKRVLSAPRFYDSLLRSIVEEREPYMQVWFSMFLSLPPPAAGAMWGHLQLILDWWTPPGGSAKLYTAVSQVVTFFFSFSQQYLHHSSYPPPPPLHLSPPRSMICFSLSKSLPNGWKPSSFCGTW